MGLIEMLRKYSDAPDGCVKPDRLPQATEGEGIDPADVADTPLDQLASMSLVITVKSYLLGEDIYVVSNSGCRQACPENATVYTVDELAVICNLTKSHAKRAHFIKKLTDGVIVSFRKTPSSPSHATPSSNSRD